MTLTYSALSTILAACLTASEKSAGSAMLPFMEASLDFERGVRHGVEPCLRYQPLTLVILREPAYLRLDQMHAPRAVQVLLVHLDMLVDLDRALHEVGQVVRERGLDALLLEYLLHALARREPHVRYCMLVPEDQAYRGHVLALARQLGRQILDLLWGLLDPVRVLVRHGALGARSAPLARMHP